MIKTKGGLALGPPPPNFSTSPKKESLHSSPIAWTLSETVKSKIDPLKAHPAIFHDKTPKPNSNPKNDKYDGI